MAIKIQKPKAIIFDWDNTLVDTWPIIHRALHETFIKMGLEPWSLEWVKNNVRKSMRDSFPEIFGENWENAAKLYQERYRANHLGSLTPLAGAKELLEFIAQKQIPAFVVSNKKGGNLREEVKHLGWEKYFKNITGADDAEKDKPHPHPVSHTLKPHGLTPSDEFWFIGDSEIDLETAKNTGCTAILYGEHAKTHESYTETHYYGFPYAAHVLDHAQIAYLLGD